METGKAADRYQVGDSVYCYGPVCETVTKSEESIHPLRPPLNAYDAVCLDPALFAYVVLRDARVCLGDNVVLFGLGAIGLFVAQMLKLVGCLNIIGVDPIKKRRQLARDRGADLVLNPTQCDVALEVRKFLGQGADIAIEASGFYAALRESMRAVRPCARIATLGYYKGAANSIELAAEWHHNRLELIGSMPVWDNPMREHPIWDLDRVQQTLVSMFAKRWLTSADVVEPVVSFPDAAQAFMDIYHDPSDAVKLGIKFPT
jgi:threonine dehydrogenase-like Zn-dependent dehydrogenase